MTKNKWYAKIKQNKESFAVLKKEIITAFTVRFMAKIGYLPLYIKLYDDYCKGMRPGIDEYNENVKSALKKEGLEMVAADVCRVKSEFDAAVNAFEKEGVDCIVTLHLAYSPSLESLGALLSTNLPIIVLDTTCDYEFTFNYKRNLVNCNHGIHGVQDMCSVLKRNGRSYRVFAGHYKNSDVIEKVANAAKAIACANVMKRGVKTCLIGGSFEGMGDFAVSDGELATLGVKKLLFDGDAAERYQNAITEEELREEYEKDLKTFKEIKVDYDYYKRTERVGLGIRKWLDEQGVNSFSMNFLGAGRIKGFDGIAFSEACKAMSRGIGYAGEGDILTASLLYGFLSEFKKSTFAEMFCPDWANDEIFFSHMGECNLTVLKDILLVGHGFPYTPAFEPTGIAGKMKGGKVALVNIAPNGKGSYHMTFTDGEMKELPDDIWEYTDSVSGWFKPVLPVAELLKKYSEAGATHHSLLVYGADSESLCCFAEAFGFKYDIIR